MIDFVAEANQLFEYSKNLRRDFHMHPELGFEEVRTAGIVAKELGDLGFEVRTGVGKTGVVGLIEGSKPGPVVLARFDMDALPMQEETGASYASKNDGVMHACGHDAHTAIGLTVAKLIAAHVDQLEGVVKLVFQPGEEGMGGAPAMMEDGVLENPRPDYALAIHVWNELELGNIGLTEGPVMASADTFDINITGKGAHAATPHLGIDPITAAAQIISTLQMISARELDSQDSAVLSITSVHGGTAYNIIPPDVNLKGTLRTYKKEVREMMLERINDILFGVGKSMRCEVELIMHHFTPAVVNHPRVTEVSAGTARQIFPEDTLLQNMRLMGSEDMAYMLDEIPGCYIFVGSKNVEKDLVYGHHHPKFDIDEQALPKGAALISATIFNLLTSKTG